MTRLHRPPSPGPGRLGSSPGCQALHVTAENWPAPASLRDSVHTRPWPCGCCHVRGWDSLVRKQVGTLHLGQIGEGPPAGPTSNLGQRTFEDLCAGPPCLRTPWLGRGARGAPAGGKGARGALQLCAGSRGVLRWGRGVRGTPLAERSRGHVGAGQRDLDSSCHRGPPRRGRDGCPGPQRADLRARPQAPPASQLAAPRTRRHSHVADMRPEPQKAELLPAPPSTEGDEGLKSESSVPGTTRASGF